MPPTTTTLAPTDAVRRVVARLYSYSLTDPEAGCIATGLPPAMVDALDQASEADPGAGSALALAQALARCEPATYVASQAGLLTEQFGVTDEQATCITRAVDQVAVADPVVAAALLDTWTAVPAGASRDAVIDAAATCVDRDLAVTIITP